MSNRLLLLIDENWPQSPAAPWVLLDDANRPLSEGRSEPRHWPAADRCEVILGGAQCVWHQARLPKGARRDEARLLGYALEDRLLREPDSQHLTVIARDAADDGVVASVLVVARDRLRALLAQLEAIGRSPAAVHAEIETAPASEGNWCLSSRDSMLLLRRAGAGEVIDGPLHEALPIIEHALAVARAANRSPTALVLHMPPGTEHVEPDHGTALPGTTIRSGAPYLWWQNATAAHNLLHDEFASRAGGGTLLSQLRKPALLAALAATVLLGASLAEVMWQKSRLSGIEERMRRIFSTAMPNTPAIAPAAQLNRQLNLKRSENGRLRDDDLLALLAIYGEARGVEARNSVASLRYNDHKLELTLPALDAQQRAVLAERLASRGLRPAFLEGQPLRLTLSREVTR